jgi:hypothetical protein
MDDEREHLSKGRAHDHGRSFYRRSHPKGRQLGSNDLIDIRTTTWTRRDKILSARERLETAENCVVDNPTIWDVPERTQRD